MGIRVREGLWHYRFTVRGKEYTGTTGLPATERNKREARLIGEQKQRDIRAQKREAAQLPRGDFATAAGQFMQFCKDVKYRQKEATWRRLKNSFASLVEFFGGFSPAEITAGAIDNYKHWRLADHKVKDVTLRHDLHALSLFFQHGIKQQWCAGNPVRDVEIPSDKHAVRDRVLTIDEEKKYFAAAKKHRDLYDVGRLMLNQGFRPEEILFARKSQADLEQRKFLVTKGKTDASRRTVDLNEESVRILKPRMKGKGDWLFPSPRGGNKPRTGLIRLHDTACLESGVSFVLYTLRHTFATRMASLGVDPITLASIMGHANLRTIQRYVHPQAAEKLAAQKRYEAAMVRQGIRKVAG